MITEDYVSFETAKLLKEKGFVENTPVNYFVGDDKPRGCIVGEMIYHKRLEEDTHLISTPTLQMAMKWLRENFNMNPVPYATSIGWYFEVFDLTQRDITGCALLYNVGIPSKEYTFDTYEEACEAAIKYCLENLI